MELSKSELIRRSLRVTAVIKHGDLVRLAKKYNTSRELVRQQMSHPTVRKLLETKGRPNCTGCDKLLSMYSRTKLCRVCLSESKWQHIKCSCCQKDIKKVMSQFVRSDRHYCSRSCRQKHIMALRWNRPTPQQLAVDPTEVVHIPEHPSHLESS